MTTDLKAFVASATLHLLAVGSAVAFAAFPQKPSEPLLVDFSIESGQPSDTVSQGGDPGAAARPAPFSPQLSRQEPADAVTKSQQAPTVTPNEVQPAASEALSVLAAAVPPVAASAAATSVGGGSPSGLSSQSGEGGNGEGSGTGADVSGSGSGSRGDSAETLRERYLKKHFGYIRDLINGNLRYPGRARRMGWSGALKVEFVVREDGSVSAIRVAKSSGVPLLDSDAEETVRRSAPFPKPPVSARLIIPVEYVLE